MVMKRVGSILNSMLSPQNHFKVSNAAGTVVIGQQPIPPISKGQALNLAAYLVLKSGATEEQFFEAYDGIQNAIKNGRE